MDLTLTSLLFNLCIFVVTLSLFVVLYFKHQYTHWDQYSIPVIRAEFPFGSLGNVFKRTEPVGVLLANAYKHFKSQGARHGGFYILRDPIYMPVDPLILKTIFIKNFNNFTDRSLYANEKDPLSVNVMTMDGQQWKNARTKLTPTFSSGKMKQLFQVFIECGEKLVKKVNEHWEKNEPVGTKDLLGCFTTDIIGNCAFGIDCNSIENPDSDFRKYGTMIFNLNRIQAIKALLARNFPGIAKFFGVVTIPRDLSQFMTKLVSENIRYRETNNYRRNDFFQLLIDLESEQFSGKDLKTKFITAHTFVFFVAGFETSSTAMTFALYELASNPIIQDKLRDEIEEVIEKHGGITYDAIMEMDYLNKVVDETLRKHPPIPMLGRKCTQDFKIEGTDVVVRKGLRTFISVLGMHHDPEYYPEPEKFDPERFNEENRNKRPPCTFLPFGEGPRNCIGLRFGLLQVKMGLVVLLKNFKFSINPRTGTPKRDALSFINRFKTEVWLDVEKL